MVGGMAMMTSDETAKYLMAGDYGRGGVNLLDDDSKRRAARFEAALLIEKMSTNLKPQVQQYGKTREAALQQIRDLPKGYITPEGVIKVSTVDAQLSKKLQERRDEREVAARLALVDAYGEDVYPDGTVITFSKMHSDHGKVYDYAALKKDDRWYTTGTYSSAAIHNWDTLIEFLVSGPKPVKSFIVKAEGGTEVPASSLARMAAEAKQ